jgi:para-nitrobenzyl esterase
MEVHKVRVFAAFAAALTLLLAAIAPGSSHAQSGARAATDAGEVEGIFEDGLRVFKGIPYAAPPVGELRWRAPRPPLAWQGVRQVYAFGPGCPQASSKDVVLDDMSEDCLTLNVWTPARRNGTRLPVMVWLHGGAFEAGSARMPIYDGSNLASRGVVMVTLNYRLGYFGFFGHPKLTEEANAEGVPTANYGLLDQVAALEWVKRNIEAFGGDPANVTLFGESAGGVSVLALMIAPSARGLFQKAIIQSGGGRWVAPSLTARSGKFLSAHEIGEKAASTFGVAPENAIAELRAKSWEDIQETLRLPELADHTPFIDGKLLTDQIEPVFARGEAAPIPVIVGANSYEGVLLRKAFHVSEDEVTRAAGPDLDELSSLYPPQLLMTPGFLADHIWGDAKFVEPARMIARAGSRKGQTVYHYCFDFQPPLLRLLGGSPHGLEVAYALGNLRRVVPFPLSMIMHPHNYVVSRLMTIYWTNFAKSGNPNDRGELQWPRFAEGKEETLVFGNDGLSIERDYLKERLDLIQNVVW